jgi:hypothetical protein
VYWDRPAASSSHRVFAHHSSLLTPSIALAEVTPPLHPTHRSNGDYGFGVFAQFGKLARPTKSKKIRNMLV